MTPVDAVSKEEIGGPSVAERSRAHLVTVARDTGRYGAGVAATRLLTLLMLPIATRLFSPGDFGTIELLTSFTTIFSTLVLCGVDSAVEALYFDPVWDRERPRLVSTALWFVVAVSGVLIVAVAVLARPLGSLVLGRGHHGTLVVLAAGIAALAGLTKFAIYVARLQFRVWAVTLIGIMSGPGALALAVGLVLARGTTVAVWQTGVLLAGAVAFAIALGVIHRALGGPPSLAMLRVLVPLAGPFLAASGTAVLAGTVERYLLAWLASVQDVGLYAVAARLGAYLTVVLGTVSLAWSPIALKIYYDRDAFEVTYRRGLTYFMASASFLGVALTALGPEVVRVLTVDAYAGATAAVGGVAAAAVAGAVPMVTAVGLILRKRSGLVFLVGALSLVVNVGLSLLLIPLLGILGAALATAGGQIAFAVTSYVMTERLLAPFRFDGRRAATVAIVGAVYIALLSSASTTDGLAADVRVRLLALATFMPALVGLGVLSRADLGGLARAARRFLVGSRDT